MEWKLHCSRPGTSPIVRQSSSIFCTGRESLSHRGQHKTAPCVAPRCCGAAAGHPQQPHPISQSHSQSQFTTSAVHPEHEHPLWYTRAAAGGTHAPSTWPHSEKPLGPGHYEYLPFHSPFRMIMGTAPLDPLEWIQIDPFYVEEMEIRRNLFATQKEAVLASIGGPQVEDAKRELLSLLLHHLPTRFPHVFKLNDNILTNNLTLEHFDVGSPHWDPLELAARLVQEDLCIMLPNKDTEREYYLAAGAVLFPNGWDLNEKLGKSTADIHSPVPLYQEKISRRVDAFMCKLSVEKPFWRANWTITSDPTLFRPITEVEYASKAQDLSRKHQSAEKGNKHSSDDINVSNAASRLFTRSERETFVRLPRSNAVLFTIRTFLKPLSVFQGRPELAAECVRALDVLPEEIVKYKMIGPVRGIAREFLVLCAEGLVV